MKRSRILLLSLAAALVVPSVGCLLGDGSSVGSGHPKDAGSDADAGDGEGGGE